MTEIRIYKDDCGAKTDKCDINSIAYGQVKKKQLERDPRDPRDQQTDPEA